MLDLRFGPDVPAALAELLAHHGRAAGVPLADLEAAGRDLATAEAFIVAAEHGEAHAYVRRLAEGLAWAPAWPPRTPVTA